MTFKGLIFDLDNTFYSYKDRHKESLEEVFKYCKKEFGLEETHLLECFQKARKEIHKNLKFTASSHNRLLYFQRMLEILKLNSMKYGLTLYNIYWNTFLENLAPFLNVKSCLNNFKDRKICILTDLTSHIQYRKILKLGLERYVDYVVTSEETGVDKPDKKMFMTALKKMELLPNEVCMVGDNFEKDIMGGNECGIFGFWFNPDQENASQEGAYISVSSFDELQGHLK
ncbi:HAD family hydrolase [Bacteriovoracales bacterium]|nr:HAD family hydrolase [Bacteriovoracales bacterium]